MCFCKPVSPVTCVATYHLAGFAQPTSLLQLHSSPPSARGFRPETSSAHYRHRYSTFSFVQDSAVPYVSEVPIEQACHLQQCLSTPHGSPRDEEGTSQWRGSKQNFNNIMFLKTYLEGIALETQWAQQLIQAPLYWNRHVHTPLSRNIRYLWVNRSGNYSSQNAPWCAQ